MNICAKALTFSPAIISYAGGQGADKTSSPLRHSRADGNHGVLSEANLNALAAFNISYAGGQGANSMERKAVILSFPM